MCASTVTAAPKIGGHAPSASTAFGDEGQGKNVLNAEPVTTAAASKSLLSVPESPKEDRQLLEKNGKKNSQPVQNHASSYYVFKLNYVPLHNLER